MRLSSYRPTWSTGLPVQLPPRGGAPTAPAAPLAPAPPAPPTVMTGLRGALQTVFSWVGRLFGGQPAPSDPIGGAMPTLRQGARGASVRTLQQKLAAAGFNPGPADGIFGPRTRGAVIAYQRARGLLVDGIVGPQTWGSLNGVSRPAPVAPAPSGAKARRFTDAALRFLNQPYRWGGGHASKTGVMPVDCSGLVLQAARMAGFNLDGTAATQQRKGRPVSMNALQPGDLLFHGTPASHVGIYLGNNLAVHASSSKGKVMIVNLSSYRYFDNARRVL